MDKMEDAVNGRVLSTLPAYLGSTSSIIKKFFLARINFVLLTISTLRLLT